MNKLMTKGYTSAGNNVSLDGYIKGKRFTPHGEVSIANGKGQRVLLGQYLNGQPNGKWLRWYDDGTLMSEHQYASGVLVGISKQYWANGKLAREARHEKGLHTYEVRVYNKKGREDRHQIIKKGRLVKAKMKVRGKWLDFDSDLLNVKFPWTIIPEKLCYVNQNNQLRCKTPYQMWRDLNTFLDPDTVENILNQFNDLYADLGLNSGKTVLTSCGGTFVATGADTSSPTVNDADDHNASRTQQESADISNACLSIVTSGLNSNGIDTFRNNDQGTRDAINTIDQIVSNCVDSDNSMIALGPLGAIGAACLAAKEVCAGIAVAVIGGIGYAGKELIQYVWDDGWDEEIEIRPGVYQSTAASDPNVKRTRDENTGQTVVEQPGTPQDNNQEGRTVTTTNADGTSKTEYYDKDGNLIRYVERDAEGNVTLDSANPPDEPTGENDGSGGGGDGGGSGGGGAGGGSEGGDSGSTTPTVSQPIDESGRTECERLASWWAMKKAYCEQSNWQTYDCQEVLRVFTGCADPAEVYPTPDGNGVVCPHEGDMTMEEFRQRECEKKSMIMIPSGFGGDLCAPKGELVMPERDICTDPRAQCLPDMMVPDEPLRAQYGFTNVRRDDRASRQMKSLPAAGRGATGSCSYDSIPDIGEDNFEARINTKDDRTHFVVFASKSCGPCHKVLSVFNDEAQNHKKATFNRVDVAQNPDLSKRLGIKYTPTIIVFNQGKIVGQRKVGAASREVLVEYIKRSFNVQRGKGKTKAADRA